LSGSPVRSVMLDNQVFDVLSASGILLPRHIGVQGVHEDTEFEGPSICNAYFHSGVPFKIGAFSGLVGGIVHASIGRYCSVAGGVVIGAGDHPTDRLTTSWLGYLPEAYNWLNFAHGGLVEHVPAPPFESQRACAIGNDVWIGANAFIKGGVSVGDGAVIAGGAVVVKNVAPYQIVGGNPAHLIRLRFPTPIIDQLIELAWWNYSYFEIAHRLQPDISKSIESIRELIGSGEIVPFVGKKHKLLELAESLALAA
jgi:virginiamycin A acetyltransferase